MLIFLLILFLIYEGDYSKTRIGSRFQFTKAATVLIIVLLVGFIITLYVTKRRITKKSLKIRLFNGQNGTSNNTYRLNLTSALCGSTVQILQDHYTTIQDTIPCDAPTTHIERTDESPGESAQSSGFPIYYILEESPNMNYCIRSQDENTSEKLNGISEENEEYDHLKRNT